MFRGVYVGTVCVQVCKRVRFLKGLEEWRSGDGESVNSKHFSILLFPSAAHESLMLELGCWLISHLCAHSIDRLPADCWAGQRSHWVCAPSLTVSLLFFSLSFCLYFNRALMASAPNLTSSTHSLKHTYMHTCELWVGNSLLVVGKKVLNRKKNGESSLCWWRVTCPPFLTLSSHLPSAYWLIWPPSLLFLFLLLLILVWFVFTLM